MKRCVICARIVDEFGYTSLVIYYWNFILSKYMFCLRGVGYKVEDVPEDLREIIANPFFEIDLIRYCSEHDLEIIERYI